MASVEITRRDLSASGLRAVAARTPDARQARRILAIAMVLDGHSRLVAARAGGMDRQTLRDWVHRYNGDGIDGLRNMGGAGRKPALSAGQLAELRELVLAGPDPAREGVVRWRCIDLRSVIAERYEIAVHERTVGKWLRGMGMTRLQPRPYNPKKDIEAQTAFKKTSPRA